MLSATLEGCTLKTTFATLAHAIKNEAGATAIEYGLIAALIAIAAVSAVSLVGTSLSSTFSTVASSV